MDGDYSGMCYAAGWFASTFNTVWEEGFDLHKAKYSRWENWFAYASVILLVLLVARGILSVPKSR